MNEGGTGVLDASGPAGAAETATAREDAAPGADRSLPAWLVWSLAFVPFAVMVVASFAFSTDDALITLRFASNAVHGHGLAFNPGQPVEGYSSPAHLLLLVVLWPVTWGHELLVAKLASVAFGLAALAIGVQVLRRSALPQWAVGVGALLLGTSRTLAYSSVNGLETTLVAFLILLLALLIARGRHLDRPWMVGSVAAVLALSRPEGALLVAALAAAALLDGRRSTLVERLRWVAVPAGVTAAYVAFRLAYFGHLLPNTYYAKRGSGTAKIEDGVRYVLGTLVPDGRIATGAASPLGNLVVVAGIAAMLSVLAMGVRTALRADRGLIALPAVCAAQLVFAVWSGGDWMQGSRFVAPVIVPLLLLEVFGLVGIVEVVRRRAPAAAGPIGAGVALAALAVPVVAIGVFGLAPAWDHTRDLSNRGLMSDIDGGRTAWVRGADLLACAEPGDLVAYSEMGYAGFARRDLRFLDLRGLVDERIAHDAPREHSGWAGIHDPRWYEPTSAVGAEILRRQPKLILTLDGEPPTSILDGRYERILFDKGPAAWFHLYRRADVTC